MPDMNHKIDSSTLWIVGVIVAWMSFGLFFGSNEPFDPAGDDVRPRFEESFDQ